MRSPPPRSKTLHHRRKPAFKKVASRLARRVRALREERGWGIEAAAEKFGIEPAHVRRIEGGDANPSLAILASIATAFDLSVGALIDGALRSPRAER